MYTVKIINAKEDTYSSGEAFFDVEVGVFKGKKQVDTRMFGFTIESTKKEIKAAVDKFGKLYNQEAEMAILDANKQKKQMKINKTIKELKGE